MSENSTTDTDSEQITKLQAKRAVKEAYEQKKEEWKSGDVVVEEMAHMYSLAVQRIEKSPTDTDN